MLLEFCSAVFLLDTLVFARCLFLSIDQTLVELLVLVDLSQVHHPLFQPTLIAVWLFEVLVRVFVEEDRHPLAQCSTTHSTQQDRASSLLLELGTIVQFRTIL